MDKKMTHVLQSLTAVILLAGCSVALGAAEPNGGAPAAGNATPIAGVTPATSAPLVINERDYDLPYHGPVARGVDTSTLAGSVMCGYQGWFNHPADGHSTVVKHWGPILDQPASVLVDLWPDLSEFDADERYPTNLRHPDGSPAEVFSSVNRKTVLRHFRWMQQYGITGVFVQRFLSSVRPERIAVSNTVLANCREGASTSGRSFAIMYDMGFDASACDTVRADWGALHRVMKLDASPAYQQHRGGPVIALWGYGIGGRRVDQAAATALIAWLKRPENGGCTVLLGTGNDWQKVGDDPGAKVPELADIIQPWTVGRYATSQAAGDYAARLWPGDQAWCKARGKDYYAVVFPGFSWHNLMKSRNADKPLDQIPRHGGRFMWDQMLQVKRHGMDMAYVAMFDELDEGTAILKVTNQPPVGSFVTYGTLPNDQYLRLAGAAAQLFQGKEPNLPPMPDNAP